MNIMTDNYRAALGLSGSRLGVLNQCPAKYKYAMDNPKEATPAMLFGTLCHTAVLEPKELSSSYSFMREGVEYRRNTKEGKANYAALEAAGKPIITFDQYQSATEMSRVVHENPDARNILSAAGEVEKPIYWEEQGVQCKGRLDKYLTDLNIIVDYKTTNDASPNAFYWKVMDFGYLLQMAHYQAGIKATMGLDSYPAILILAQESDAPYISQVYEIPQVEIDVAHEKRRELLDQYRTCLETGVWGGYGQGILTLVRK